MSYDYNNQVPNYTNYNPYAQQVVTQQRSLFNQVYLWMTGGLFLTALIALVVSNMPSLLELVFGNTLIFFGLVIAEVALVFIISASINRMSATTATGLFMLYAMLNGVTLSLFFLLYTRESIGATLFITGGTFGFTSLYGYTTKRDLTSIGSIAFMALIGIILASVVNWFLQSTAIYWAITYLGIAIFVALTAYDTQKIKRWSAVTNPADQQTVQRLAILGALTLYLDFINLFVLLLRIFGRRR